MGNRGNWQGEQAAILANNKPGRLVYMESFSFYIIKNLYDDSLTFRLMLYEVDSKGYPGATFLRQPIVFRTNLKEGEVTVDLFKYGISYADNFFISLECLEQEMESEKFCYAGSISVASYFKNHIGGSWGRVSGGGGDFNIKVSYTKK